MGNSSRFKIMLRINKNKKIKGILISRIDGQASLEFVLIIPFLILIISAVSHLGLIIYQKNVLEQAAREGARVVATTNSNNEAIKCIREVCSSLSQDKLYIKIVPKNRTSREVGDMVEVIVTYDCGGIISLIRVFAKWDNQIKAKSSMRVECY